MKGGGVILDGQRTRPISVISFIDHVTRLEVVVIDGLGRGCSPSLLTGTRCPQGGRRIRPSLKEGAFVFPAKLDPTGQLSSEPRSPI